MAGTNTITRRQFWSTALLCALVLIFADRVVARMTRNSLSRRILQDAANSRGTQVIAIGNSLMRSGFDAAQFAPPQSKEAQPVAVNLAMGASTPPEHLLLLRAALRANHRAQLLLYGFYDFQLTDPVSFAFSDLVGNHDLLYYDEPKFAEQYYSMPRYDRVGLAVARRAALLEERGAVWAKVERVRRALAQQGMPAQAASRFGRAADFTLLESASPEEFARRCERGSQAPLNAPVEEMIREARASGLHVVLVLMPLPPRHVQSFYDSPAWQRYLAHVRELLAQRGVAVLDASRWISNSAEFGDALHLTDQGAGEFSRRLGAVCGNLHQLNGCGE